MIKKFTLNIDLKKYVPIFLVSIGLSIITVILSSEIKENKALKTQVKEYSVRLNDFNTSISEKTKLIKHLKQEVSDAKKSSLIQFTDKELMRDIILNYPQISTRVKKVIITTILEESVKYNINPLIIYSLLHTESSMRPWIEHKPTTITKGKKKIKIRAVGLGGVVWEWWGDKLKANNIAEVRSDLFDPETNIKATIFVYNELFKKKKHPKAKTQDESAMIRYFGGGYKWYFEKIDSKIAQLVSNRIYRKDIPESIKGKNEGKSTIK